MSEFEFGRVEITESLGWFKVRVGVGTRVEDSCGWGRKLC